MPMSNFVLSVLLLARKNARIAGLAVLAVLVSSCASMSEQECLTANWLDQGFRDGRNGEPLTRIEDHRQACAKVGVRPDQRLYLQGRDRGILHYCTSDNAVQEGLLGRQYRNACPAHLEHRFLIFYERGKQIYDAEQYIEKLNKQTNQLEQALKQEENKEQRSYLRQELRDVDRQLQRAREDLRYLERRLRY
jgi:hypothetical protein